MLAKHRWIMLLIQTTARRWLYWQLNQPTPPLERRRVVVPDRAQSCRQVTNVVFLALNSSKLHHMTPLVSFSGSYAFGSAINPYFVRLKAFWGNS
ncbi:hypothetical protein OAH16_01450 [bacterium]|nr:hypothetical protein [bacterium]